MKVGTKILHGHEVLMGYGFSSTFAGCMLVFFSTIGSIILLITIGLLLTPKEKND